MAPEEMAWNPRPHKRLCKGGPNVGSDEAAYGAGRLSWGTSFVSGRDASCTEMVASPSAESASSSVSYQSPAWILPQSTGNLFDHYVVVDDELGRGQFGVVRTCLSRTTGQVFACKSVSKAHLEPGQQTEGLQTEISLMGALSRHPHIVAYEEVFEDESNVHLIMERCMGGDLFSLIETAGNVPEPVAAPLFRKIVSAVEYCHLQGLVHRDIKPENILLAADESGHLSPKLADFGLAQLLGPQGEVDGCSGSISYLAPEVIVHQRYTAAADIWSLGVLLYVTLSGSLPYSGTTAKSILKSMAAHRADITSRNWRLISSPVKDLLCQMLSLDPRGRPTAAQILAHPWVQTLGSAQPSTRKAGCEQTRSVPEASRKNIAQVFAALAKQASRFTCKVSASPLAAATPSLVPSPPASKPPSRVGRIVGQANGKGTPEFQPQPPQATPSSRAPSPRSSMAVRRLAQRTSLDLPAVQATTPPQEHELRSVWSSEECNFGASPASSAHSEVTYDVAEYVNSAMCQDSVASAEPMNFSWCKKPALESSVPCLEKRSWGSHWSAHSDGEGAVEHLATLRSFFFSQE